MSGPPPFCRSPLHSMMPGECPEHPKDPTAVLDEVFFFFFNYATRASYGLHCSLSQATRRNRVNARDSGLCLSCFILIPSDGCFSQRTRSCQPAPSPGRSNGQRTEGSSSTVRREAVGLLDAQAQSIPLAPTVSTLSAVITDGGGRGCECG